MRPDLRLVRARNVSPMTFTGTNSYILGRGSVAVIDPGPEDPVHLAALLAALDPGERVAAILVTHAHVDHSALAPALRAVTGAPVLAFGDALSGRTPRMRALARAGLAGGGEGVDTSFAPDRTLADGEVVSGPGWSLAALWTPGHFGNHLSYLADDVAFTGDVAMGWASTLISPPDGDLAAFLASLDRLRSAAPSRLLPGHGEPVDNAIPRLDWLIAHRHVRTRALLASLGAEGQTIPALRARLYADTPPALWPAAERNIFAHLIDLEEKCLASADPAVTPDATYRRP